MFDVHHKPYRLTCLPSVYFSQVHKVHINIQRKWPWEILHVWNKTGLLQPTAPRTVSDALAGAPRKLTALWFSQRSSTKNHRTVRWDNEHWSTLPNGRLCDCARGLKRQKSEDSLRRQVAPDCSVQQKDKRLQRSTAPNPNGRPAWHSPDSVQWSVRCTTGLSGAPPDCPVCPLTEQSTND
jgi:hypothetical protein